MSIGDVRMKYSGIFITLLLLFFTSCSSIPERFADAPIDKDAPVYISCQPADIAAGWREYLDEFVKSAAHDPQKDKTHIIRKFLHFKLLLHHAGLNEIKNFKASSTPLLDGRFDNRLAVSISDAKDSNVKIFGKNCDLYSVLAKLPANCADVIVCSLDLESAWNSIKNSSLDLQKRITFYTRILLKTSPDEIAKSHNGIWVFGAVHPRYKDITFVTLPDSNKTFYNKLKNIAQVRKKDYIQINIDKMVFFITNIDGRTTIYNSEKLMKDHMSAAAKLGDDPNFIEFMKNAAHPAVFLSWTSKDRSGTISFEDTYAPAKKYELPEYFICRRTPYGFYGSGIERNNWATEILRDNMITLSNWLPSENQSKKTIITTNKKPQTPETRLTDGCARNIEKLALALKEYAASNNGLYPSGLHIDGLNKLLSTPAWKNSFLCCPNLDCEPAPQGKPVMAENTSYVYFGNWKKGASPKLPLIIDLPENHNGYFYAVLNDNSVQKFSLKEQMCVKRMASYLHTVFNYKEQDFSDLIQRAEELDKILDKESK